MADGRPTSSGTSSRRVAIALAAVGVLAWQRQASGNGAFPDSQAVLMPGDRAAPIVLATNFGLLLSYDGGGAWLWSCEQDANAFGFLYQYGGAPRDRMFAVAGQQLVYSDDDSCTWHVSGGGAAGRPITDAFAAPGDADRVVALAYDETARAYMVLESRDGGTTFGGPLYTALPGVVLTGLEIAASDPRTLYLTMAVGSPPGSSHGPASRRAGQWLSVRGGVDAGRGRRGTPVPALAGAGGRRRHPPAPTRGHGDVISVGRSL